jgi:hypothetical protein
MSGLARFRAPEPHRSAPFCAAQVEVRGTGFASPEWHSLTKAAVVSFMVSMMGSLD